MRPLIQKLHTYAGLLTFVNLAVFGLAGLSAPWVRKAGEIAPIVRYEAFRVQPNLTDRQTAEGVAVRLHLSLATPIQNAVLQHDGARNLLLDFWHANGRDRVTVLGGEGRLRVETMRNSVWSYLATLHATTAAFHSGDWRMQLWAGYNEFAMWCLIGMIGSGVALWLMARPRHRLGQASLRSVHLSAALLCLPFLLVYVISGVQMAHRRWIPAATAGVADSLNRLHRARELNAWAAVLELVSVGLLLLGATGLWLWFRNRTERRTGGVLLAAGAGMACALIVWMRMG